MILSANTTEAALQKILQSAPTIVMVGMSPDEERPSHNVARYLQQQGYRVIPVNPVVASQSGSILGEPAYASVTEAGKALQEQQLHPDIVDCFRKGEAILPIAQEAIAAGARCLWMQKGVTNPEAAALADAARMLVVQDACIKVQHSLWFGTPSV